MSVLGLCGGIGAGKSTVARRLQREFGAVVIDVDQLGHAVLEPAGRAYDAVIAEFGTHLVTSEGAIDRAALGRLVFSDSQSLAALEAISHPAINHELDQMLAALPDDAIVVLDMAILVESTLGRNLPSGRGYDTVLVVAADREVRLERLVNLRGMDRADALARMDSQATDAERRAVADHVVTNNGTEAELVQQIDDFVAEWLR